MGRIGFFLGVSVLFLLLPVRTPGFMHSSVLDNSSFALTGSVFADGGNQRVSNAVVVLCDNGGNPLQQTPSTDSGEFNFQGLRAAHYVLRVSANGFQSAELHLDLSFASQRGLTVSLKPVHAASLPPPGAETVSAHELSLPKSARDFLASGKKKLYMENNPQGALLDFQSAISQSRDFFEAHYQTGMAYLALQNPADAEKQFRKSVELSHKKYGDADIALGTLLLHRREQEEGEALLRQGIALNPHSWPGQFELGELELSRGHVELALAAAQMAQQLAPQQAVVYRLLAVIYMRQKDYPALLSALDSYIGLDPASPAGTRAKELRVQTVKQMANSPEAAVAVK